MNLVVALGVGAKEFGLLGAAVPVSTVSAGPLVLVSERGGLEEAGDGERRAFSPALPRGETDDEEVEGPSAVNLFTAEDSVERLLRGTLSVALLLFPSRCSVRCGEVLGLRVAGDVAFFTVVIGRLGEEVEGEDGARASVLILVGPLLLPPPPPRVLDPAVSLSRIFDGEGVRCDVKGALVPVSTGQREDETSPTTLVFRAAATVSRSWETCFDEGRREVETASEDKADEEGDA